MADNEEGQTTTPRAADWEVVSLTASAYAASPGGVTTDSIHGQKGDVETSNALLMSGHFVLPTGQHENPPPEPENTEILGQQVGKDDASESVKESGGKSDAKEEENLNIKKLTDLDDFHGLPFSDDKSNKSNILAFSDAAITQDTSLSGLNLGGKQRSIYCSPKLHSLHSEATLDALNIDEETRVLDESIQSSDVPNPLKQTEVDSHEGSDSPCAAWWKKQAASLYAHARATNTFWSIFGAAAVMGLLVIGQQERWRVLCHDWKLRIHDERMRMMAGPISRIKDAIVGGNRQDFSRIGSTSRER